jgi:hypothetical protein
MMKLSPDERCECGGPLYAPELVLSEWTNPSNVDYVCAFCGSGHKWTDRPPQLAVMLPAVSDEQTDAESGEG